MRRSLSFSSAAAPRMASPSTIVIRLPTGLCDGMPVSESARTTMIESGSRPSSSATRVATMVSWPCPADAIETIAVTAPSASTRSRQPSGNVVLSLAGFMMFSKIALPPLGFAQLVPAQLQRGEPRLAWCPGDADELVQHGRVVAGVVLGAARNPVGELVAPDEVAPPDRQPVHAEAACRRVHRGFDRVVGRRLAEAAHRDLAGLVRGDRGRGVGGRADPDRLGR